jgi:hypothetical protein
MKSVLFAMALLLFTTFQLQAGTDTHHRFSLSYGVLDSTSEVDNTFGVEYEIQPIKWIGAGLGYEYSGGTKQGQGLHTVVGSFFVHPWKGLRVGLGGGYEQTGHYRKGLDRTLIRYSSNYDFNVCSGFAVSPFVVMNRSDDKDTQQYGLSLVFKY